MPYTHTCAVCQHPHKPQMTGQYWNKCGDRLWIAYNMGWGNPFWAHRMGKAVIGALTDLNPCRWLRVVIACDAEENFRKYVSNHGVSEYLVVRATPHRRSSPINSYFFLHGVAAVPAGIHRYTLQKPRAVSHAALAKELTALFDISRHPLKKNLRRFDVSSPLKTKLQVSRLRYIIRLVRRNSTIPFTTRLANHIRHDQPLLAGMVRYSSPRLEPLLSNTGMLTPSEMASTIIELEERIKAKGWQLRSSHRGLPAKGAQLDRKARDLQTGEPLFDVLERRLSVLSRRLKPLPKATGDGLPLGLSWMVSIPEDEDECLPFSAMGRGIQAEVCRNRDYRRASER